MYPPPRMTWAHGDGTVILASNGSLEQCLSIELRIDDLKHAEHDKMNFVCSASNGIGQPITQDVTVSMSMYQLTYSQSVVYNHSNHTLYTNLCFQIRFSISILTPYLKNSHFVIRPYDWLASSCMWASARRCQC